MTLRVLKFIYGVASVGPFQCVLDPPPAAAFAKLKTQGMYAAYVVRENDLESFRKSDELFLNRGRKHAAKALADLLLGHEKIPFISGGYATSGRLTQGVVALLKQAAKQDDCNLYIIGANEKIFAELWQKADRKSRPVRAQNNLRRALYATDNAEGSDDSVPTRLLLELLPHEDIPAKLQQTYVGASLEAQLVRHFIMRAASLDTPVLIIGPTGTGKEVVAQSIHKYSARRDEKFMPLNCGAIPSDLLESQLFGAVKGVATGVDTHAGLWELADRGTLFLDEVGDLIPLHQAKILRALEEKKILRLGDSEERETHARIVAATNRDLFSLVRAGQFREDLFYRLASFTIRTPTLRNNPGDIPILAQAIWKNITDDKLAILPDEIILKLQAYRWPGNVRELKAILINVYNLFGAEDLGEEHLEAVFRLEGHGPARDAESATPADMMLLRVECLRHLRRVDEVVRASKVALRPLVEDRQMNKETVESVASVLSQRLSELEILCLRPSLFNSEVTFAVVHRLKAKLYQLHSLLRDDPQRAPRYWKQEVADEFKLTLTAVFQEVGRVTARS